MFEMTLKDHKGVVQHAVDGLVCIGARRLDSLEELSCTDAAAMTGWPTLAGFGFTDLQQCVTAVNLLDPTKQEGFVVADRSWRRIKVVHPAWSRLHGLGGADRMPKAVVPGFDMESESTDQPHYTVCRS